MVNMSRDVYCHEYNESPMFLPDYCSENEWDNGSSSGNKLNSSSKTGGYFRGSFGSVDSGWKRQSDTVSSSTVLTWKFYSLDGLRLEEHAVRWHIVQHQDPAKQIPSVMVDSTVLCTKGIRPTTTTYSHKKRSNKDASMFLLYSGTEPANSESDSETLVDFDWEAHIYKGSSPVQFELIAYRSRSPMFRQYDFLINGTSFFELAEYSGKQVSAEIEKKACSPRSNRRGAAISKLNKKVFPSKNSKRKPQKECSPITQRKSLTRSLSPLKRPFVAKVSKSLHRRGSSMISNANTAFSKIIASNDTTRKVLFEDGTDIDQAILDSNLLGKDEKTIEADTLFLAYAFTSQKLHSLQSPRSTANRQEFTRKILSHMITLVVTGKLHADVATRIVHCVATMAGFPVMVQMSNIVLLLSLPDYENISTLTQQLRSYGEIENIALSSEGIRFGVCAFRSGTDAATAIRASCRGELMITIRNLEFAFQSSAESLESYSFQHFPGHQEKVKFSSNSSTCTVKRSNVPKPDAKLAKPERIRTCTLEGYRDKALDAFRRGVENTVKDCEGILNRAITMALLDSGSVSVLEQSESSSAADLEAKLLCTAGNIHQNSKACPDRSKFLEDAVFQLASCVRNRMVKPQHAANIIHECAALLDLRLFRPPNKPSVILGGIQNDCTTEDLQLCLKKFGEIDEVSVDGKGNGYVRWKNVVAINRILENLENIPAKFVKPIGTFPSHQTDSPLWKTNDDAKENVYDERKPSPQKPGSIPKLSHACSLNSSASTDVSFDSADEEYPDNSMNKCVLDDIDEDDIDENKSVDAGEAKKEKSSSTYFFHKYKRWVSKGFVSFLNSTAEKSRSFSSMHYS